MLFPMLIASWFHLELYFSAEYQNFQTIILILFWKYLVDFRSKAVCSAYRLFKNCGFFQTANQLNFQDGSLFGSEKQAEPKNAREDGGHRHQVR
jgi:hypothetical protein